MEARLAAGDENLPYQLFAGPETQALFRVSSNRRGIERFENGACRSRGADSEGGPLADGTVGGDR